MEMVTLSTINISSIMTTSDSRQITGQIAELRELQEAALQLERGGTVSLRSSKKQRHSIADLIAQYLSTQCQKRGGRWAGQPITREELAVFARERGLEI